MISYTNSIGIDFDDIDPSVCESFFAQKIEKARVLWLNRRVLFSLGIDVNQRNVRSDVENEFLQNFGRLSRSTLDVGNTLTNDLKEMRSDRYGGTGGHSHGGSGRCGAIGGLNAKGIGMTPLVEESEVDWWHSTGLMWLSEAIREAVWSEILNVELPFGANPVLAIIDTGFSVQRAKGERHERCGIVVRPNVLRPAHLERSIYFGTSGFLGSDQEKDTRRVEAIVQKLETAQFRKKVGFQSLDDMMRRFSIQFGVAHGLKIWLGRFITSNCAIDGSVLDFGSVRSVDSWRKFKGQPGEVFGQEGKAFGPSTKSLRYYLNRFSNNEQDVFKASIKENDMAKLMEASIRSTMISPIKETDLIDDRHENELSNLLREYRYEQNKFSYPEQLINQKDESWNLSNLESHQVLKATTKRNDQRLRCEIWRAISDIDTQHNCEGRLVVKAQRFYSPRPQLFHDNAVSSCAAIGDSMGDTFADLQKVSGFIEALIGGCTRRIIGMSGSVLGKKSTYLIDTWIIQCETLTGGTQTTLLIAPVAVNEISMFGVSLGFDSIEHTGFNIKGSQAFITIDSVYSPAQPNLIIQAVLDTFDGVSRA